MPDETSSEERLKGNNFDTQSGAIMGLVRPHLEAESGGIINKDLKISNIRLEQLMLLTDMTDVILQCKRIKCDGFAWHLLQLRDAMLCASSSVGGFERTMQVSTVNITKLPNDKNNRMRIFNTRGSQKESSII